MVDAGTAGTALTTLGKACSSVHWWYKHFCIWIMYIRYFYNLIHWRKKSSCELIQWKWRTRSLCIFFRFLAFRCYAAFDSNTKQQPPTNSIQNNNNKHTHTDLALPPGIENQFWEVLSMIEPCESRICIKTISISVNTP